MLKFKCLIQDENDNKATRSADRRVDVEQKETTQLGEFEAWVKTYYQIPGELSLYYGRKKLDDPRMALRNVLAPGDTLTVAFDKTVRVGGGGLGTGGEAEGVDATGGGGYGGGGEGNEKSVAGGAGYGGAAEGDKGTAGTGYGGVANTGSASGIATGGAGFGGAFKWTGKDTKKQDTKKQT